MAVVVNITFPGNTLAQYDAVMKEAGLIDAKPDQLKGIRTHYAWEEDGNLHVLDIWDDADAFEPSFKRNIAPAAQRAGIELHPTVKISPLHNSIP